MVVCHGLTAPPHQRPEPDVACGFATDTRNACSRGNACVVRARKLRRQCGAMICHAENMHTLQVHYREPSERARRRRNKRTRNCALEMATSSRVGRTLTQPPTAILRVAMSRRLAAGRGAAALLSRMSAKSGALKHDASMRAHGLRLWGRAQLVSTTAALPLSVLAASWHTCANIQGTSRRCENSQTSHSSGLDTAQDGRRMRSFSSSCHSPPAGHR